MPVFCAVFDVPRDTLTVHRYKHSIVTNNTFANHRKVGFAIGDGSGHAAVVSCGHISVNAFFTKVCRKIVQSLEVVDAIRDSVFLADVVEQIITFFALLTVSRSVFVKGTVFNASQKTLVSGLVVSRKANATKVDVIEVKHAILRKTRKTAVWRRQKEGRMASVTNVRVSIV